MTFIFIKVMPYDLLVEMAYSDHATPPLKRQSYEV